MKGRDLRTLAHREHGFGVQRALHFAVEHGAACPAGGGKVGARHAPPQRHDAGAEDPDRAFHAQLNGLAAVGQEVAVLVDGPQLTAAQSQVGPSVSRGL